MSLKTKLLSEQVALVTGGGTGIGRAFASALSGAGARVVIASRDESKLRSAADELNSAVGSERVFTYAFDVRARQECEALVAHCVERFGSIDVLVKNPGPPGPERGRGGGARGEGGRGREGGGGGGFVFYAKGGGRCGARAPRPHAHERAKFW